MAGDFLINGVNVKSPKEMTYGLQTIDSDTSGRNASGTMVRDVITKKVKLDCNWGPLSNAEASALLSGVSDDFFTVTYPDPLEGMTTKIFYVGDRTLPVYSFNERFNSIMWQSLAMNFIER